MIYLDDIADEEVELESQDIIMKENSSEGKIDAVVESCDMRRGKIIKRNSEYHSRPPTKDAQYSTCASFEEAFRFPIFKIKLPRLSQLPPIVSTPSEILDLPAIDIDNLQKSKSQI
jgi:hypothetical protein